jgi:glycerol-1-phosphate dehydrogenase [NAD(P)+]
MQQWLEQMKKAFPDYAEFPERMVVASGALAEAARYVADKGWRRALLVADGNTHEAAGMKLAKELADRGVAASVTLVKPNPAGDVVADEASVVQVLLDLQQHHPDVLIAVGSGTLHDITRYSAYTVGKPFVSVPTAPSVDGFNSKGAPLLIRGEKITIPSIGPVALFADAEVLLRAPRLMTAAGFGDMLGKATSLFDWRIGHLYGGEPYSDEVANITRQALERTIRSAADIGQGKEEAILDLMRALLESGIAMLIFGQSHPASGAEHHLSHYWEMAFIRSGRRQLLHGAKVGVACGMIADLYHAIGQEKPALAPLLADLPTGDQIREWLAAAGAPTTPDELGIEGELVRLGLAEAHKVRLNRTTLLRLRNEGKLRQ